MIPASYEMESLRELVEGRKLGVEGRKLEGRTLGEEERQLSEEERKLIFYIMEVMHSTGNVSKLLDTLAGLSQAEGSFHISTRTDGTDVAAIQKEAAKELASK